MARVYVYTAYGEVKPFLGDFFSELQVESFLELYPPTGGNEAPCVGLSMNALYCIAIFLQHGSSRLW